MKLRRLLAGFVAVSMTVGMMPAVVFAKGLDYEPEDTEAVETTEPETKETSKPEVKETEKPVES